MLVPGDVYALKPNMKIPCDSLLFDGEVVLNESNMTGEGIPIPKYPV